VISTKNRECINRVQSREWLAPRTESASIECIHVSDQHQEHGVHQNEWFGVGRGANRPSMLACTSNRVRQREWVNCSNNKELQQGNAILYELHLEVVGSGYTSRQVGLSLCKGQSRGLNWARYLTCSFLYIKGATTHIPLHQTWSDIASNWSWHFKLSDVTCSDSAVYLCIDWQDKSHTFGSIP